MNNLIIGFIIILFAIIFIKQQFTVQDKLKSIFEIEGIDQDECMTWALGEGYGNFYMRETDEIWNKRHGDLFIMKGTDLITDSTLKIINEYKKHKGIK